MWRDIMDARKPIAAAVSLVLTLACAHQMMEALDQPTIPDGSGGIRVSTGSTSTQVHDITAATGCDRRTGCQRFSLQLGFSNVASPDTVRVQLVGDIEPAEGTDVVLHGTSKSSGRWTTQPTPTVAACSQASRVAANPNCTEIAIEVTRTPRRGSTCN